jgi:HEAT repeat protein
MWRCIPSLLRRTALPVLFALLTLPTSSAPAAPPAGTTPVEQLRRALEMSSGSLEERNRAVQTAIGRLDDLADVQRALALPEWRDRDLDERLARADSEGRTRLAGRYEQAVRALLWDGQPALRQAVLTLLAETGATVRDAEPGSSLARRFTPDLAELVGTASGAVQEEAVRALGRISPDLSGALPALQTLLEGKDVGKRLLAASALTDVMRTAAARVHGADQPPARRELAAAASAILPLASRGLADADPRMRRLCVGLIRQAGAACELLQPESAPNGVALPRAEAAQARLAREEVAEVLRALKEARPALAGVTADADPEVRRQAREVLDDVLVWEAAAAGNNTGATPPPTGPVRTVGYEEMSAPLAGSTPPETKRLLERLTTGLADPDVRARREAIDAVEALGAAAEPLLPALAKALEDRDLIVRWAAARTLGALAPRGALVAVPALARALADADLDVFLAVAAALERYGGAAAAAVPALLHALESHDPQFRAPAARTLGEIGPAARDAVTWLARALRDEDARVRLAAARALGKLGPAARPALDALQRALHDPDPSVREAASESLVRAAKAGAAGVIPLEPVPSRQ